MWKKIEIAEQKYLLHCLIESDDVHCILYNMRKPALISEKMKMSVLLRRVKQLNPFVKIAVATICDALENSIPEQAMWFDCAGDGAEKKLQLNYSVHNRPFYFEWHLQEQNTNEIKQTTLNQLFGSIFNMSQEIWSLCTTAIKKDMEIQDLKSKDTAAQFDIEKFLTSREQKIPTQEESKADLHLRLDNLIKIEAARIVIEDEQYKYALNDKTAILTDIFAPPTVKAASAEKFDEEIKSVLMAIKDLEKRRIETERRHKELMAQFNK